MERFSILFGKDKGGRYSSWKSPGLTQFFQSINIKDVSDVITKLNEILGSYVRLSDADSALTEEQPVAWRYAPMHISKIEGMPKGIEPFGAMSVAGPENRDGAFGTEESRASDFSHITVIPREAMLNNIDGYTYLDQLFGTHFTTWCSLKLHREEIQEIDLDALPEHVDASLIPNNDRILGAAIASELFTDGVSEITPVLIRIEKCRSFNARAKEILKAVYAILPQRMAFENGFAAYQDTKKIADILCKVSINIFVVPAEANLAEVGSNIRIFDLSDDLSKAKIAEEKKENEVFAALKKMWKLSPEERFEAYKAMFPEDDADFFKSTHFLEQYQKLMDEIQTLKQWKDPRASWGSPSDLAALASEYPICAQITNIRNKILSTAEKTSNIPPITIAANGFADALMGEETLLTKELLGFVGVSEEANQFCKEVGRQVKKKVDAIQKKVREDCDREKKEVLDQCEREKKLKDEKCQDELKKLNEQHGDEIRTIKEETERKIEEKDSEISKKDDIINSKDRDLSKLSADVSTLKLNNSQLKTDNFELKDRCRNLEHELRHRGNYRVDRESIIKMISIGAVGGIILAVAIFCILHFVGVLWAPAPVRPEEEAVETVAETVLELQEPEQEDESQEEEEPKEEQPIEIRYDNLNTAEVQFEITTKIFDLSNVAVLNLEQYSEKLPKDLLAEYEVAALFQYLDRSEILLMKKLDTSSTGTTKATSQENTSNAGQNEIPGENNTEAAADTNAQEVSQPVETPYDLAAEYCYVAMDSKALNKLHKLDEMIQLSKEKTADVLFLANAAEKTTINLQPCFDQLNTENKSVFELLLSLNFQVSSSEAENEILSVSDGMTSISIVGNADGNVPTEAKKLNDTIYMLVNSIEADSGAVSETVKQFPEE